MGCGCKNNQQAQPQVQQSQVQQPQPAAPQQQNESVKAAIKKTVEKYYNENKSSK
jgi:hypothetical protein